jgi:hypothetical protein
MEEPDIVEEPEPDYDDQPSPKATKIPTAPPLPDFLAKRTVRL